MHVCRTDSRRVERRATARRNLICSQAGAIAPSLCLWYNAPSSQLDLTAQLKRDYMALSHISSCVTMLAADGRVLHQNGARVCRGGQALVARGAGRRACSGLSAA